MRSASIQSIAAILYANARDRLIPFNIIQHTMTTLLRYAREERDWRGYIAGKGWAHAMAHLADALDECVLHPEMTPDGRIEILETLRYLAHLPEPLYYEEDVRLATVAYDILAGKQVDSEYIDNWLERCYVERDDNVSSWISATNAKNFLRSLYFLLHWNTMALNHAEQIIRILQRQDAIYIQQEQSEKAP